MFKSVRFLDTGSGPEPAPDAAGSGAKRVWKWASFLGLSWPPSRPLLTTRTAGIEALPLHPMRPPDPETGDTLYLLEYKPNIFARNIILSTKSTLVGGQQLGGLFILPPMRGRSHLPEYPR